MLLVLLLFSSFLFTVAQDDIDSCAWNLEVVTDLLPADCYARLSSDNKHYYFKTTNCLPVCEKFATSSPPKCTVDEECPSGYICADGKKCSPDTTTCSVYYVPYSSNSEYYKTIFRPTCDTDGYFAAKQCKGEATTGRCFCFDANGRRTFGQQWSNKASDMTCACSRKKADLRAIGEKTYVSLHCDTQGNYEPLQCDIEIGLCWCADNKNADLKSVMVPLSAMNRLPCYATDSVGSQYLRQCESLAYAQATILNKFKLHGSIQLSYNPLFCDEDGTYGSYRLSNGIAYCTWKDNSNIGTWQSPATEDLDALTCNCARDSIYFSESGSTLTQSCLGNGNYKEFQTIGTASYCVDTDGYQTNYQDIANEADCEYFRLPTTSRRNKKLVN